MKRRRLDIRVFALLALAFVVVTACGTTVPPQQLRAADVTGEELDDLPEGALPPGAVINDKGQVVSSSGEVLGSAEDFGLSGGPAGSANGGNTGGTGVTAAAPRSGGAGTGVVPAAAPGVTDTKMYWGIPYSESGPANQATFGISLDADNREPFNAIIEEVNEAGGLWGRKVVPLYYKFDGTSAQTIDQQQQAACAYWTQDNKVFAIPQAPEVLRECAHKAGAIVPAPGPGGQLPETYERYPHFWEISGLNHIRAGNVTIKGLDHENYFGKAPKIGIVLWDEPEYRGALERGYLPEMKDHRLELATEPGYISSPQQANDMAATSADINNAVLRFQAQGITHVMILDGNSGLCAGGCLTSLFMQRADQQEYFPRYGLNANNGIRGLQDLGLIPQDQLSRAIDIEWTDDSEFADEGWKKNGEREACEKLMRRHDVALDNGQRLYNAHAACEIFWFMQMLDDMTGTATLTADNVMSLGVNRVGWSFDSPLVYAVHLSATQHDGNSAARNMKYVDPCECWKWAGKPYRV